MATVDCVKTDHAGLHTNGTFSIEDVEDPLALTPLGFGVYSFAWPKRLRAGGNPHGRSSLPVLCLLHTELPR